MNISVKLLAEYEQADTQRRKEIIERLLKPKSYLKWHDVFRTAVRKFYYEWGQDSSLASDYFDEQLKKANNENQRQRVRTSQEAFVLFLEQKPCLPDGAVLLPLNEVKGKMYYANLSISVAPDVVFEFFHRGKMVRGGYLFCSSKTHPMEEEAIKSASYLMWKHLNTTGEAVPKFCCTFDVRAKSQKEAPLNFKRLEARITYAASEIGLWVSSST
ncbi:hypothetical protein D770_15600 [Flammeovirgaceae bacterium 311]|nr:hypothetical protein D770_15600 [Flammeovirgaceae bacterium 311]